MTRRDLMRILLASAIAESVDVERLLWVPKPLVTVPTLPLSVTDRPEYGFAFRDQTGSSIRFVQRYNVETDKLPNRRGIWVTAALQSVP